MAVLREKAAMKCARWILLASIAGALGLGAAARAGSSSRSSAPQKPPRPDIVILLADDLGWGDVGYHGGSIRTPNIDALAREGVRLERFHVAPLCSPTRAGLMIGRWPIRCGMGESVITPWRPHGLALTERTIADRLAEAGYERRGVFGKWHLGHYRRAFLPLSRGFTHFYGHYNGMLDYFTHLREGELDWHRGEETCRDEGYSTDLIAREAVRFIAESPAGKPYFLYVPFNAPHSPLEAKESDLARYRHVEDERRRRYAAMVDGLDQAIGRILAAIEERGTARDTFLLFLSDNGGVTRNGSNGPWRAGKGSVYEGGVRVPAVVRWPRGIAGGGRSVDALMGYIDVLPTLKRVAGVEGPDPLPLDGRDMLDVIRGEAKPPRRLWFHYIAQGSPDEAAVCDGVWKLVARGGSVLELKLDAGGAPLSPPAGAGRGVSLELYRLDRDPGETRDVAREHPDIVRRLLGPLREFRGWKPEGVPDFRQGRKGFKAPVDWVIRE